MKARTGTVQPPAMDAFTAAQSDAIAAKLGVPGVSGIQAVPEPMMQAPAPVAAPPKKPSPPPVAAVESPVPAVQEATPSIAADLSTSAVEGKNKTEATVASAAAAAVTPVLPLMFELPLATRKALPPLKVTMFVYSEDRARRFAIIDGKRVNENGVMGNDLNLIEIQRDGMVLDFRGTRFLLPRLGR